MRMPPDVYLHDRGSSWGEKLTPFQSMHISEDQAQNMANMERRKFAIIHEFLKIHDAGHLHRRANVIHRPEVEV